MPIVRCTITLEARSGVPADRATNTYHFDCVGVGPTVLENIRELMVDLYSTEPDAPSLQDFMSNELCGDLAYIQLYNLDDPEPRSPIAADSFEITPVATPALPPEVALVVSFRGTYESGEPNARRRGRVYLPWLQENGSTEGRPADALVEGVVEAFTEFKAAADASVSVNWVVWSPTADAAYGVLSGWVDNEWDTQRRRGIRATTRTFFS